jgi:hypothetical protein
MLQQIMTNCRRTGKEKGLPVFYCRRIRGMRDWGKPEVEFTKKKNP